VEQAAKNTHSLQEKRILVVANSKNHYKFLSSFILYIV